MCYHSVCIPPNNFLNQLVYYHGIQQGGQAIESDLDAVLSIL
jgi:hypothetical protein